MERETKYFYDGYHFGASIDRGYGGFFELYRKGPSSEWKFIMPGTIRWDALHQDIYYAHHDLDPCPPSLQVQLPMLPPVPNLVRVEWKDNFLPLGPLLTKDLPTLTTALLANGGKKRFWFVLDEDLYETFRGDGSFQYFHGSVLDNEADASRVSREIEIEAAGRAEHTGYPSSELKEFSLEIQGDSLVPVNWFPERPQDYSIEKIIARIEAVLVSEGAIGWGEKYNQ